MLIYSRDLVALAKEEDPNVQKMAMELINTNNVIDIATKLAEMIISERERKPIVISQEDMDYLLSIFRVKGYDANGNPTRKGRPIRED